MAVTTRSARTRSRTVAAASGLAALAMVMSACGEGGEAEKAIGDATSAAGSVAAEATSAAGAAMNNGGESGAENSEGQGGATTGDGPTPQGSEEGEGENQNLDEAFLNDLRQVGVDAQDEQEYITRGRNACISFDEGIGYIEVLTMYNNAHPDSPASEAPAVVTVAAKDFCPQHLPLVGQGGEGGGA